MDKRVTIVVAALNEQAVIEEVMHDIYVKCNAHLDDFEIIAINDGSNDFTGEKMEFFASSNCNVTVIHNAKPEGLGSSFRKGLNASSFPFFMLLCGDGGFPPESLPAIFDNIGRSDILIPFMTNLKKIKTPFRYLTSRSYTLLLNKIFNLDLVYYNGLPLFRSEQLRKIDIISNGFAFQGEILIKLIKSGKSYTQIGVLGAEKTNRSTAVSLKNVIGVIKIFLSLVVETKRFIK